MLMAAIKIRNVPPPRRRGDNGSERSILDDVVQARDAVGIERCDTQRLQGTLYLLFGPEPWAAEQISSARERLRAEVERTCAAFVVMHRGDPCALAAADSLQSILLQPADGTATASALRRRAREARGCHLADDSLRKREAPIMESVAANLYQALSDREAELLPTKDSIVRFLKPYSELAALNVGRAAKLFSQRAALEDDNILYDAVAHAVWAVAQFGVLPLYGLQRLEALGITNLGDQVLEYMLAGIIQVPFTQVPDDINQLATATQLGEEAEPFYDRLLATPVMRPVVERFVTWLAGHDPKICLYDSNDVMVGYCGPHYYVSLCQEFADAAEEYPSGELTKDFSDMLSAVPFVDRARHRDPDQ